VLAANAVAPFEPVASSCIQSIAELLKLSQVEKPLQRIFLKADPTTLPVWREIMERNSPGQAPAGAPVFIAQGTGDVTVRPAITLRFAKQLCAAGTPVMLTQLKGRVPQLDRGEERAPGHQMDGRPLRGAAGAERLRPLT
jgi:hypothetical protein